MTKESIKKERIENMRIEDVAKNNQDLPKKLKLNTEEGRQAATLSVLTDISETLALLTDLYAMVHGRVISKNGEQNAEGK